ncbi:hypothetical protein [Streptomyces sp. NPDC057702]|uniref:hypothetical protein n=1 Tax=unclassified Streptomyces TaxID=2593676 RepID=UPI0036CBF1CA
MDQPMSSAPTPPARPPASEAVVPHPGGAAAPAGPTPQARTAERPGADPPAGPAPGAESAAGSAAAPAVPAPAVPGSVVSRAEPGEGAQGPDLARAGLVEPAPSRSGVAESEPVGPALPRPAESASESAEAAAPLGVVRTPTGVSEVDAGLRRLGDLDHLPVDGHREVYEDVHRGLRDVLDALDQRPGPGRLVPAPSPHDHRS